MKFTPTAAMGQVVLAGLVALAGLQISHAQAQPDWPNKPIRFVVPYTPGGGTDTVTRHIANNINQDNKWVFLIDNKPGGGGNIGLNLVAKAKPDGYTIGMGQTSNLAINPAALPSMPFDPAKDLVPVALVAEVPMVLVVRPDSPYKSLADIVSAAKAKPGGLKQAVAGLGTVGHLAGEMLARNAGIKILTVPYKGAAPAVTELLGGLTDFMFVTPQTVMGMIQSDKLRILAVTSLKRSPVLPNVPTVSESGFKDFEAVDWKVIVAPAGTPPDVVKRLNAAIEKALASAKMQTQLAAESSTGLGGSPEKAAQFITAQQAEWGALVREAGIRFE